MWRVRGIHAELIPLTMCDKNRSLEKEIMACGVSLSDGFWTPDEKWLITNNLVRYPSPTFRLCLYNIIVVS